MQTIENVKTSRVFISEKTDSVYTKLIRKLPGFLDFKNHTSYINCLTVKSIS